MIVVDVNVVVYLLTACDQHDLATALWERSPDWRLPSLWRHEFLNVLSTMTRLDRLTVTDASELWARGLALFSLAEVEVDGGGALELAAAYRISGYDAQYAALAMSLNVPLVSEDARLRKALPALCLSLHAAVTRLRRT